MAAEAHSRGIELVTDFAGDAPPTRFDEARIRQVVLNLVRNAIEALDGAHGTIRVRTRGVGRFAELSVEDDGPGIQGDPTRIFRAFHTTKSLGTGLGLTIAQRIATEHGGELRVESERGRTVFTLALPAATPSGA
jgi:signal transduction histidine kinase